MTKYQSSNVTAVVIDMQENWLGTKQETNKYEMYPNFLIPAQQEILKRLKKLGTPIIVVEFSYLGNYHTIPELEEIIKDEPHIEKKRMGAFDDMKSGTLQAGYPLLPYVQGRDYILLMGVAAKDCVMETARGALNLGFTILTAETLIADDTIDHVVVGKKCISTKAEEFYRKEKQIKYVADHHQLLRTIQ